jgi:hypothetical protein
VLHSRRCDNGHQMRHTPEKGIHCQTCERAFKRDVCSHVGFGYTKEWKRLYCKNCGTLMVDPDTGLDEREDRDETPY